jgi:hypothetical protein
MPAQAHVLRQNSNWQGAILGVAQKNALTHTQAESKSGGRVKGRCSLITRVEYAKRAGRKIYEAPSRNNIITIRREQGQPHKRQTAYIRKSACASP